VISETVIVHDAGEGDEPVCNTSSNPSFSGIVEARLSRRGALLGGLSAALGAMFIRPGEAVAQAATPAERMLGFAAIPVSDRDTIVVPQGYTARVITPWGEPITGSFPAFSYANTGAEQGMQIGQHHDGMHFFPIEGRSPYEGSSTDGLLVMNHEYNEPRFLHAERYRGRAINTDGVVIVDGRRDTDEVLKEINAHASRSCGSRAAQTAPGRCSATRATAESPAPRRWRSQAPCAATRSCARSTAPTAPARAAR